MSVISGPDQAPKESMSMLMCTPSFKHNLGRILQTEWVKGTYSELLGARSLYVSHGGHCVCISRSEGESVCSIPNEYQGSHEEADTLVAFHVSKIRGLK